MKKTQKTAGPAAKTTKKISTRTDKKAGRKDELSDGWQRIFDRLTLDQQRRVRTEAKSARKPLREYLFDTVVRGMVEGDDARRECIRINSTIGKVLGKRLLDRIDKASSASREGLPVDVLDMVRIGVGRVLDELESSGSIKAGAKFVAMVPGRKSPRRPDAIRKYKMEVDLSSLSDAEWKSFQGNAAAAGLTPDDMLRALIIGELNSNAAPVTVSAAHQKNLRFIGDMLELNPGTFLQWLLDDHFRDLLDPSHGALEAWATGGLVKYPAAAARRVKARYLAWEKKQLGRNLKRKGDRKP